VKYEPHHSRNHSNKLHLKHLACDITLTVLLICLFGVLGICLERCGLYLTASYGPDYDVKRNRTFKLYMEIINVYDNENVSGYNWNGDYTERRTQTQLGILPSVGITIEF
jgi:hypothetical protein